MKRYWLLFSQTVTVLLAAWFVVATLQPQWLQRPVLIRTVPLIEAPAAARSEAVAAASLSMAAQAAAPAVVSISARQAPREHPHANDPWFRFGDQVPRTPQTGLGSGVIISSAGHVLTNHHVIEGAEEIEVQLSDGRQALARVVGTDPDTDLAVLQIDLPHLPVAVLGDSDALRVGDAVLAIGNPFGVGQTVTGGIVSALGRTQLGINIFENFIQTDAAINPGNSGGALVDVQGHLIGINTAIFTRSGGFMGIGFAIPTSTARQVLEAIVRDGAVTRGWIGVEPQALTPELAQHFGLRRDRGVIIIGVLRNAPAAQAGIRPGDVVVSVAGQPVADVATLLATVAALPPGQATQMQIERQGERFTLQVTPGRRPPPPPTAGANGR
ncbi:trypsin-like serine protease, typically periplasmic, contain C-terminal PDZ domain [Serpentinimonas raichei]|uniref:Trypsin-like serine protease, typically periplasmic, contain C-terminal PDZ domain n=1 Tax=Serpentinimonas raichei TaxID=1458425 RepID=A0A060NHQ6_9BURK|nr:trypsin-like peptidase domain-containing protein [Serpentinimonas raichei]BAO81481.1 trypsin-like serine protease, typically periplasmic, contain C-terminal PDZ domain [Serpentinimonas raichei]